MIAARAFRRPMAGFAVNPLNHRQEPLALSFAARGGDRFAAAGWVWNAGLPHIVSAAVSSDALPSVHTARVFGTHFKLIADRQTTIRDAIAACAH